MFHAGYLNYELFEQIRYCFVYNQDLALILLGLSFIEHTLGALLFKSGRDELEQISLIVLTNGVHNNQRIDDAKCKQLMRPEKTGTE